MSDTRIPEVGEFVKIQGLPDGGDPGVCRVVEPDHFGGEDGYPEDTLLFAADLLDPQQSWKQAHVRVSHVQGGATWEILDGPLPELGDIVAILTHDEDIVSDVAWVGRVTALDPVTIEANLTPDEVNRLPEIPGKEVIPDFYGTASLDQFSGRTWEPVELLPPTVTVEVELTQEQAEAVASKPFGALSTNENHLSPRHAAVARFNGAVAEAVSR